MALAKGWLFEASQRWKASNPVVDVPLPVHVDCDAYAATVDVLELCSDYVEHGVVFRFDDYFRLSPFGAPRDTTGATIDVSLTSPWGWAAVDKPDVNKALGNVARQMILGGLGRA